MQHRNMGIPLIAVSCSFWTSLFISGIPSLSRGFYVTVFFAIVIASSFWARLDLCNVILYIYNQTLSANMKIVVFCLYNLSQ